MADLITRQRLGITLPTYAEVIVIQREDLPPTPEWELPRREADTFTKAELKQPLRFEGDDG